VDINQLPSGSRCFVDANILIYYLGGDSRDCRTFIQRIARDEVDAHISTTALAEALHRQTIFEAIVKGLVSPGKALNKLKKQPQTITQLSEYITFIDDLLALPLHVITVTPQIISISHHLRLSHGLLVNDSINLASAFELQISDIGTNDTDFNRVPNIVTWSPTDI
jgi:predicted nucleic acid-binding protein